MYQFQGGRVPVMQPKTFVSLTSLILCCACVPPTRNSQIAVPMVAERIESSATLGAQNAPTQVASDAEWSFGDPQLVQLFALGLKDSPDYAQVISRVRKADALAGVQRSAGLPQVSTDASLSEAQATRNLGFPPQFTNFLPKGFHSNSRVSLGAVLDADLFGRNKALVAASISEADAARFDVASAHQALLASIAEAYIEFAQSMDDEAAATSVAAVRDHELELATARLKAGLDDQSVVIKATSDARTAREAVADAKFQISIARYRIAALVGQGPDFGTTLTAPSLALPQRSFDQVGVDVIANRPDVASAKQRIEAQAARVKAARRDFYPNISLSALAGFQSFDLGQLLLGSSAIPSVGAAIHLPIFDSGRLKAAYHAQQADYDAAVAYYNATILRALQDVSTSFARLHEAQTRYDTALANVQDAVRADGIANDRTRAKIVSEYSSLPVRRALLEAQARATAAREDVILAQVDVLRALGGRVIQAPSGEK